TAAGVAAVAWAGLALVPLPVPVLRVVAPHTVALAIEAPAAAGLAVPAWHSVAVDPSAALEGWITGAAHLAIFVVASASFAGRRGARTFAATLVLSGAAIAVLAILEALTHAPRIYWIGLPREQFYGTFVNGNHTADLLAVCTLAGLGVLLRERDVEKRAAWGVAAVVCSVAVMHSLSRGGMLALGLGLAVFLGGAIATQAAARTRAADELGRFFRRHAILLMLLTLAVFYLSWLEPQKIGRELETLASLHLPTDYRTLVWKDAMRAASDWPLTGAGTGNFGEVFAGYRTFLTDVRTEMAESEYVQIAVENGFVGLALLVAGTVTLLLTFGARYVGDPMRFSGAHLGLGAALFAIAAHSVVDFPLRLPAMGAIAAAIAGALAGAVQRTRPVPMKKMKKPPRHGEEHGGGAEGAGKPARRSLRPRAMRTRAAAWALLPAGMWGLAPFAPAAERAPGTTLEDARAEVLASPADARAWARLARRAENAPPDGRGGVDVKAAWARVGALDPSRPEVLRVVAGALSREGDPAGAANVLRPAVELVARSAAPNDPGLARLRSDLAENLALSGDFAGADRQLAAAGNAAGARGLYVRAELFAVRDDAPFSPRNAIDGFLAAATAFARENDAAAAGAARRRALLLAVNAARGMPPELGRAEIDRVGLAGDPGESLRALADLAARGVVDAKALWSGAPFLTVDDFDGGTPRLAKAANSSSVDAQQAIEDGTEV
ncbi:MAG TPA: O-antigen ligase family protein, partial [bacterium]|nr:O-antigen ligase family protein [bacterium]